jgi:hypothetical protein
MIGQYFRWVAGEPYHNEDNILSNVPVKGHGLSRLIPNLRMSSECTGIFNYVLNSRIKYEP